MKSKYITDEKYGDFFGVTESGKEWRWTRNESRSVKSLGCGSLKVSGSIIFSKGTLHQAIEYVSNN
jgi:hypothetical protein